MDTSYNYLKTNADEDKSILGGFYRFSLGIARCFLNNNCKLIPINTNVYMYIISWLYTLSNFITIITYLLADDNTLDDYLDEEEFIVFHIGMFLSNVIIYIVQDNQKYSFIYLSLFKLLGYLSQYYLIIVIDITIDIHGSFFLILEKIVNTIDNMFNYIFHSDTKSNEFWMWVFLVSIIIFFIIFIATGNALSYLVVFMIMITIIIGLVFVSFIMLVIPIAYVLCLIVCMYAWGLIFLIDYIQFMYELYVYFKNMYVRTFMMMSDVNNENIV
jgi:hypothetical protein